MKLTHWTQLTHNFRPCFCKKNKLGMSVEKPPWTNLPTSNLTDSTSSFVFYSSHNHVIYYLWDLIYKLSCAVLFEYNSTEYSNQTLCIRNYHDLRTCGYCFMNTINFDLVNTQQSMSTDCMVTQLCKWSKYTRIYNTVLAQAAMSRNDQVISPQFSDVSLLCRKHTDVSLYQAL